jgi:hypothetical protein
MANLTKSERKAVDQIIPGLESARREQALADLRSYSPTAR